MKHIAIFQKELDVGGIQRSLLNMLTNADMSAYDVDLFLFKEPVICSREDLQGVNLHILKPMPYFCKVVDIGINGKFYKLELPDKEYDLAIDYNTYSQECALGVMQARAKRRVSWIHSDLAAEYGNLPKYRILFNAFKRKYKYFDEYVAVSQGIVEPFRKISGVDENVPIRVIPNVVNTAEIFRKAEEPVEFEVDESVTNFVFAGRFVWMKRFDILLDEFSKALEQRKDMHLYLLGDGEERANIERRISSLGIGEYVSLCGNKPNPFPYMKKMDALVLTSDYEGQGMVLWEAKALGLDLIFSKHLEKYNPTLTGSENIAERMVGQKKHEKKYDMLDDYNKSIQNGLYDLFGE